MTCFVVVWTTSALAYKFSTLPSDLSSADYNSIPRTYRKHFAIVMTWNNWKFQRRYRVNILPLVFFFVCLFPFFFFRLRLVTNRSRGSIARCTCVEERDLMD